MTNSGTPQNAVLDFVIPRGDTGIPSSLAMVDPISRDASAGEALKFGQAALITGAGLSHQAGDSEVTVSQPGVYLVHFHANASAAENAYVPMTVSVVLRLNGVSADGGRAIVTFDTHCVTRGITLSVPVRVPEGGATLDIATPQCGFSLSDLSMTVLRLGA